MLRVRIAKLLGALLVIVATPARLCASACIQINEATQHIGETKCVTGKVFRVKVGIKGVHFLDFCENDLACPFTVVVFSSDLKDVGDVRQLEGRTIEILGAVKSYDGRPEIILSRISQITGGAAMIPPLPKTYDVETRGHFSAGRAYSNRNNRSKSKRNRDKTIIYGDVETSPTSQ